MREGRGGIFKWRLGGICHIASVIDVEQSLSYILHAVASCQID